MDKIVARRRLALLAFVTAAGTSIPALAQPTPAAAYSLAKTDAILGGAPSALQAIMAQQQGIPVPAARPAIRPASFAYAPTTTAVLRDRSAPSKAALTGRPDVFGSVALRVGHTRLDARWRRVESSPVGGDAARFARDQREKPAIERLEAVNWYVNKRVRFVDDSRQFGRADVWTAANETLSRGRGDCEDYAIAKYQMLRRAGFADRDLYFVIVKDLARRSDHAVLVVRADSRLVVLDNGTDRLLDSSEVGDYRPVFTFAATGTWTHGYRVRPASGIAAADTTEEVAELAPADDQRSRSASLLAFNTGFSR